jgi:hypothetical protein
MQTGLLWFDNTPGRELASKVEDAARRYREKFGSAPNTCYVNQLALAGSELTLPVPGVQGKALRVIAANNILPNHFWVGVEEACEQREAA